MSKAALPRTSSTLSDRRRGQPVLRSSRSAPRWDSYAAFSIENSKNPSQSSPKPSKHIEEEVEQEEAPETIQCSHEPTLSTESQKYAHADRGSSRQPVTQALMDDIERLSREEYSAAPMPSRLAAARNASSAILLAFKASSGARPSSATARVPQLDLKARPRSNSATTARAPESSALAPVLLPCLRRRPARRHAATCSLS